MTMLILSIGNLESLETKRPHSYELYLHILYPCTLVLILLYAIDLLNQTLK